MSEPYEKNIFDYLNIIKKRIRLIFIIVFLVTSASIVISFLLPVTYLAATVVMPIDSASSGGLASVAAKLTGGLIQSGGVMTGQSNTKKIMALLQSRSFAEAAIVQFGLDDYFSQQMGLDEATKKDIGERELMRLYVRSFREIISIVYDPKNLLITISVELLDPKLATQVANGMVVDLIGVLNDKAFTQAKKRRLFIEKQLTNIQIEMLLAGKNLGEYYQRNEISAVNPTVDVPLVINKLNLSDPKNQELMSSLEELAKKEAEMKNLNFKVVKGIPQRVYLEYLTMRKEILVALNGLLHNQYELARIEEAKEQVAIEVIDPAIVPTKKHKPRRRQIVTTTFTLAILFSLSLAFLLEAVENRPKKG